MRRLLVAVAAVVGVAWAAVAADEAPKVVPRSLEELRQEIDKVLVKTKTPGVGVALASRQAVIWTGGLGRADVASGRPAGADTLFRLGSISKSFVSLSILMLREEGRLGLEDEVRKLAPEIACQNPWESEEPLRVVHLLEHTTGFDDISLREYALNDPAISLSDALAYRPASRVSRWRPGTRHSYCNAGPPMAARIVEKVSGLRFEDFVQQKIWEPLEMRTASYFLTEAARPRLATLYHDDGVTPYDYWHIGMRPSGSVNASAAEMAHYVRFYLNRGSFDGRTLIQPSSLDRMERPATTWGARAGLTTGYGLGNFTRVRGGRVYYGHDGGVQGGLARLAYLPEAGLGYAFMINSGSGDAFRDIDELIRGHLTRDLARPALPAAARVPAELAGRYSGTYRLDNPRVEASRFLLRLLGVVRVQVGEDRLLVKPLLGDGEEYLPVSERLFREKRKDGESPAATLALIDDPREGQFIEADGSTLRPAAAFVVWCERGLAATCLLSMLSAPLFALVWIPRKLLGLMPAVPELRVRAWALVSVLCLVAAVLLFIVGFEDGIQRFGRPTPWSLGFWLLTLAFPASAVYGLFLALRAGAGGVNRWARWHSLTVSLACTLVAAYLAYFGLIGVRTWV